MAARLPHYQSPVAADNALLDFLTSPTPPHVAVKSKTTFARRDAALDPLLIAAAAASGPHVTRNHYTHDFFPGVSLPKGEGSWDWTKFTGEQTQPSKGFKYVSRQAPRSRRLRLHQPPADTDGKENSLPPLEAQPVSPLGPVDSNTPRSPKQRRQSIVVDSEDKPRIRSHSISAHASSASIAVSDSIPVSKQTVDLQVKCMARTRIPTFHGPVFLHLYHNNRDNKEHLALVVDPAQFSDSSEPSSVPFIRSSSLDAVWNEDETDTDRITRGAYVGKLSSISQRASKPPSILTKSNGSTDISIPAPLIRLHSECFTGETIGSMRCDCGEQLDEAIRLISQPITLPATATSSEKTIPGRGAVIYLRQEGRGIGLLSKIRAYNLQDLGYDTVTANLMLGHKADERGYEVAVAIMRDLGLGHGGEGVRVLTNNPDKVEALRREGVRVVQRVPMIPRSWQARKTIAHESGDVQKASIDPLPTPRTSSPMPQLTHHSLFGLTTTAPTEESKIAGATLIGGNAVYGADLDKYLRTKVLKMGHMLPLWPAVADTEDLEGVAI